MFDLTAEDIKKMTHTELMAFYNFHNPTQKVKKFESMTAGRIRCEKLRQSLPSKRTRGVTESWKNPAVAAARMQRVGVTCQGITYRSLQSAYDAHGITRAPMRDRAALKRDGFFELELPDGRVLRFEAVNLA